MKITKHNVEHVARLSRLRFSQGEIELFTQQLNTILDYFDKLQTLDTTGVVPSSHAVNLCNAFRADLVNVSLSEEKSLENAPSQERGCFTVPKVIEG